MAIAAILETAATVHDMATTESMAGLSRTPTFQLLVASARARAAAATHDERAYERHAAKASAHAERAWPQMANPMLLTMYADCGRLVKAKAILSNMPQGDRHLYAGYIIKAHIEHGDYVAADALVAEYQSDGLLELAAETYMSIGEVTRATVHVERMDKGDHKKNVYASLARIHVSQQGVSDTFAHLIQHAVDASPDLLASALAAAGDVESAEKIAEMAKGRDQILSYLRMAVAAKDQTPEKALLWMELAHSAAIDLGTNRLRQYQDVWRLLGCWANVDNAALWIEALASPLDRVLAYCYAAEGVSECERDVGQ